jgi:hypothetical protein
MNKNEVEQFNQAYNAGDEQKLKLIMIKYIKQSDVVLDTLFEKIYGFKEAASALYEKFQSSFEIDIKCSIKPPVRNDTSTARVYDMTSLRLIFNEAIEELCNSN